MMDEKSKAKVVEYFERLGIDVRSLENVRVALEMKDGEIIGHEFLAEGDEVPSSLDHIKPSPKKIIH